MAMIGVAGVVGLATVGEQQAIAMMDVLRDPSALLSGRSPGVRGSAHLRQTKLPYRPVRLPTTVRPDAGPDVPGIFAFGPVDEAVPAIAEPAFADVIGIGGPDFAYLRDLPMIGGGGVGGSTPIGGGFGGGGLGGGGGVVTTPPVIPVPVSPVPETATWVSMIIGFMMTGVAMRLAKRRRRSDVVTGV